MIKKVIIIYFFQCKINFQTIEEYANSIKIKIISSDFVGK